MKILFIFIFFEKKSSKFSKDSQKLKDHREELSRSANPRLRKITPKIMEIFRTAKL